MSNANLKKLCDYVATAQHVFSLYFDEEGHVNKDGFISIDHVYMDDGNHPSVLMFDDQFFSLAKELHANIGIKNGDPERPFFRFADVIFITVIDMEKAAALGLTSLAESEFYGK